MNHKCKTRFLILLLPLTISICGQKTAALQQPRNNSAKYDDAHRTLLEQQVNKAKEAGQLGDQASRVLPQGEDKAGPIPRKNYVDEYIFGRIEREGIPHSGRSTDEEFLRRAYLDATGLLPSVQAVRNFLRSKDPEKRDKLIEKLIGSEEFTEQWAWLYCDLFRVNRLTGDGKVAFNRWLRDWLRTDRPYNEVVMDLLSPSAKSDSTIPQMGFIARIARNNKRGSVNTDPDNYYAVNRLDMIDEINVETTRIFLGMNIECVSCHDGAGHLEPLNLYLSDKRRTEFQRQSAFFGKLSAITYYDKDNVVNTDYIMADIEKGYDTGNDLPYITDSDVKFPRDGKKYEPAFFLTGERPRPGQYPRREFARLLTENVQFSRATVNLVWSKLMTVGFVEPLDGFDLARIDPKNPPPKPWTVQPTYPELMEAMAADFKASNFSMHHLIKTVMKSNAYQLSTRFPGEWKDSYSAYYPRRMARMMRGPEVIDALVQVTGRPGSYPLMGVNMTRVKQLAAPADLGKAGGDILRIMQSFFQTTRYSAEPVGNTPSTLQTMLLMSSGAVNQRVVADKNSRVQQLVESSKSNTEIVEEMYLAVLTRFPTAAEKNVVVAALEANRQRGAEDLMWTLVNGAEFILNH